MSSFTLQRLRGTHNSTAPSDVFAAKTEPSGVKTRAGDLDSARPGARLLSVTSRHGKLVSC